MYRIGEVSAVDPDTMRAKVKLLAQDVETWWLEVLQRNTLTNKDQGLPDVGELVAVLLDERQEAGCILGAIYTEQNKPPTTSANVRRVTFGDGTMVEYNREAHTLTILAAAGSINLNVQSAYVIASEAAEVTCASADITVSGEATVNAATLHVTAATEVTGDAHLDGIVTVAGGAEAVALATKTANALTQLKQAIAGGVPVATDGGAALKASIMAALATWPPSVAAEKLSSD